MNFTSSSSETTLRIAPALIYPWLLRAVPKTQAPTMPLLDV